MTAQACAVLLQHLAAHQVQRLHAGGSLVKRGDAGVACELLHAVLGDVTVAAKALQCVVRALHRPFGQAGLHDRGDEAEEGIGLLSLHFLRAVAGDVDEGCGVVTEYAAAFDERFLRQQHPSHVGVDDDRVGGLVGNFGAAGARICRRSRE
jgi:hypothetical protein